MVSASLQMFVNRLSPEQVKYELVIRKLFAASDNQERRKSKLQKALQEENNSQNAPVYDLSEVEITSSIDEVERIYRSLVAGFNKDKACTEANIEFVQTHTIHLMQRIELMQRSNVNHNFTNMLTQLNILQQHINNYYSKIASNTTQHTSPNGSLVSTIVSAPLGAIQGTITTVAPSQQPNQMQQNINTPSHQVSPSVPNAQSQHTSITIPNTNSNINVQSAPIGIDMNALANLINSSVAAAVQQQMHDIRASIQPQSNNLNNIQPHVPQPIAPGIPMLNPRQMMPSIPVSNQQLFPPMVPMSIPQRFQPVVSQQQPYVPIVPIPISQPNIPQNNGQNDLSYQAFLNNRNANNFGQSSSLNGFYPINRVNVLDWKFYFSGLKQSEDPKSIDVESFLHKLNDHMRAENIQPADMLNKVQQLLRGPASDWYSYASRSIPTWQIFTQRIRDRFSTTNTIDALRQQIYSKKQMPGEYTLRFIDQFINLIYRLPEEVSEQQCVRYILKGIRTEIARMARTAHIETIADLIKYVKDNYGQDDKFHAKQSTFNAMKPHSEKRVEYLSEEEDEYFEDDFSCQLGEYEVHEVKKVKPSNKVSPKIAPNVAQKIHKQSSQSPSMSVANVDQPKSPEISYQNPCPFCNGDHSYRMCPLPIEQKPRHCFICKSAQHLASHCPGRAQNNRIENSESKSKANNEQQVATLSYQFPYNEVSIEEMQMNTPEFTFVESLIFFPNQDLRPHVTARVGDIELTGLIDTGSHATVIGKCLYERYNSWKSKLYPYDTTIVTADGTRHSVMGVMLLQYEVNDVIRVVPTLVVPYVMRRPIFGVDFQRAFNMGMVFLDSFSIDVDSSQEPNVFDAHELSAEQKMILDSVVKKLPVVKEDGILNCTNKIEHEIDTGLSKPVYQKPYIYSPKLQERIREEIHRLLKRGIIKRITESSWLNAVVAVPKPDNSVRLCIDARKLNAITMKNRYSQMNIDRIFSRISKSTYFTSIDLKDAFYQIPLAQKDQEKTAFSIHGMGIFAYKRMPQGLVNSAATLCRLVESVFNIEDEPEIFVYMDDFIVCTNSFERHIELLKLIADKLNQAGLAIGMKKSKFCMKKLKFLGHIVDENGISIDKSRLQAITTYKKPTNVREVQSFLGFTGWYRKFIDKYAEMSSPLTQLIKKKVQFVWANEQDEAYEKIKAAMLSAPILHNPDYSKPFFIDSKSSDIAVSAILYQMDEKKRLPIIFMSAKLNEAQKKYHVVERECLSLILALEKFRYYIQGSHVTVNTDYNSLTWLKNYKDPTGRIARWALRLQAYDFEIKYKNFTQNDPVCVLSRDIDLLTAPTVNLLNDESDCSQFSTSIMENTQVSSSNFEQNSIGLEICLIETSEFCDTVDDWYKSKYKMVQDGVSTENFKIENEILYHRFDKKKNPFGNDWKICVPSENRVKAIGENHDSVFASHPGFFKTLHRIQNIYYWPKMIGQIYEYVRKCEICRTTKASNVKTNLPNGKRRETDMPLRTLSCDFIGPMTMTKLQNQYLFVVIDNFTKMCG